MLECPGNIPGDSLLGLLKDDVVPEINLIDRLLDMWDNGYEGEGEGDALYMHTRIGPTIDTHLTKIQEVLQIFCLSRINNPVMIPKGG